MDNLVASPPASEWGTTLTELLRKGAGVARSGGARSLPVVPELLDSLARGVEGWNYGDKLFDTRANVPLVNSKTEDMLGALPIGTASKGGLTTAGFLASALRPGLDVTHNVTLGRLARHGELPKELYNPSFGIGKDKLPDFVPSDEGVHLIPRIEKLDPKTSNTVLTALDSWSPRASVAAGKRVDSIVDDTGYSASAPENSEYLNKLANRRLVDRFNPTFARGGIGGEGFSSLSIIPTELPRYGSGGPTAEALANALRRQKYSANAIDELARMSIGPRHQSFEAFNKSPYGADRIGRKDPDLQHHKVIEELTNYTEHMVPVSDEIGIGKRLQAILSNPKFQDPTMLENLHGLVDRLRRTNSEYGELKKFGPMAINPENFAGVILPTDRYSSRGHLVESLRKSAEARGLPVIDRGGITDEALAQIARSFQAQR